MASPAAAGVPATARSVPLALPERQALWAGARSWSAALVVAAFPFLFILDRAVETRLSPVLPGLVALLLLVVALPLAANEAAIGRALRLDPELRPERAARFRQAGRTALVVALLWFGAWLAWGA